MEHTTLIHEIIETPCIILPLTEQILSSPVEPERTNPLKKLKLCECRLSGNFSNNVEYHKNFPKSSFHQGDNLPHSSFRCTCILKKWMCFCDRRKIDYFNRFVNYIFINYFLQNLSNRNYDTIIASIQPNHVKLYFLNK